MFAFLIHRLAILVPIFLGVTLVAFSFVRILPGDPVETLAPDSRRICAWLWAKEPTPNTITDKADLRDFLTIRDHDMNCRDAVDAGRACAFKIVPR